MTERPKAGPLPARFLRGPSSSGSRWLAGAGAALLAATAGIHLDLYLTGYDNLATIGPLFLFQAVLALALGVAAVLVRGRAAPAAGALFSLATLGGYLLSVALPQGLFGFREVPTTAGAAAAAVELAAALALGLQAAAALRSPWRERGPLLISGAVVAAAGVLAGLLATSPPGAPSEGVGSRPVVRAIEVPGYGRVLGTSAGDSLYLLSSEAGTVLRCSGGCLSLWPPLLLPKGASPLGGPGVEGRLGTVRRGRAAQVTYNGYPLYTYAGDVGPDGAAGEGIVSFGGTWYLLRASAHAAAGTPVVAKR